MMRNAMLVIGLATLVAFAVGATGQEDADAAAGGDTNLRHINGERWAERLPAPGTNMTLPFNGELRPGVFESWEYTDGGRTLTLDIRAGISSGPTACRSPARTFATASRTIS